MSANDVKGQIKSRWEKMDGNQRKLALFVPCFLLVFTIATHPGLFQRSRSVVPPGAGLQRGGVITDTRGPRVGPPHAVTALQSPGDFVGNWQGQAMVKAQGLCTMLMEIRHEKAGFSGYPQLACIPLALTPFAPQSLKSSADVMAMLRKGNPSSALLSGAWDKQGRSVIFHVDKVTGATEQGCAMSGDFTVTPFGSKGLATDFHLCGEHVQVMLTKAPKGVM